MNKASLNGTWQITQKGGENEFSGKVPGDILTNLFKAGKIDDPFYRENEKKLQWVGETDWSYSRNFDVDELLLQEDKVLLQCEGVDTLAKISINGKAVASTDNMFRSYEWDVKKLLKTGSNTINIVLSSVHGPTQKEFKKHPIRSRIKQGHEDAYPGFVRKEQCNFGWDWGPILVSCGIWKNIGLLGFSKARLDDVSFQQNHTGKSVQLKVSSDLEKLSQPSLKVKTSIYFDGECVAESTNSSRGKSIHQSFDISNPQLWWPNGMGAQSLYQVQVELLDEDGVVIDSSSKRIGLRTLRLDRHKDEWGESFQFVANGVPFFAKGANWIPVHALVGSRRPKDIRRLMQDSAEANMNMMRVWGGGIYEDDSFYEACDELGLCVWQDFMFACVGYPAWDKAFMANVDAEARDNVKRLRHHASIALWCGNNELEQQVVGIENPECGDAMTWKDYKALFDKLLGKVVKDLAPETDYWPSSPHTPYGDRGDYNNPDCGDAHLWHVWHGKEPFESYRDCHHRFNSEFGFQSFPEPKTVATYTKKKDRNITTPVMEHHQRSGIGNTTIMQYMLDWFRLPSSFEMTLWTSQILQGMAIKYACEHWRRSMPRGMGTLYWQLNDVWPVASWASIDFFGRWKALHYMARNFFAPLLVSGVEDQAKGQVEVHVTSDLQKSLSGTLSWVVTSASGKTLEKGKKDLRTPTNGSRKATTLKLSHLLASYGERDLLVWLKLKVKGQATSTNLVTFARPKQLELNEKPKVSTEIKKGENNSFIISFKSDSPALWSWIELGEIEAKFSDNFFHLRAGKTQTITCTPKTKVTLNQLKKALSLKSLVDTFKV
jgi:beta-mannosidase